MQHTTVHISICECDKYHSNNIIIQLQCLHISILKQSNTPKDVLRDIKLCRIRELIGLFDIARRLLLSQKCTRVYEQPVRFRFLYGLRLEVVYGFTRMKILCMHKFTQIQITGSRKNVNTHP